MKIFKHEQAIADKIQGSKASFCVKAKFTDSPSKETVDKVISSIENIEKSNFDQLKETLSKLNSAVAKCKDKQNSTLMYGSAILVSTIMNLNDDMFIPSELWKARFTPINTPFNMMHESTSIIGHIYNCRLLSKDCKEINMCPDNEDPETMPDDLPEYMDEEVDFVLYYAIYPDVVSDILVKATNNETFVSMECYLHGFDYALIGADGEIKIVERNDDTSFLSQFLRVYGGPGTYKDYRVGRVLRNIEFSGMGNVDNPANPPSVYTKIGTADDSFLKSILQEQNSVTTKQEENKIEVTSTTTTEVVEKKEDTTKAQEVVEQIVESVEKAKYDAVIAENESLKSDLQKQTNENLAKTAQLEQLTKDIEAANIKINDITTENTNLKDQIAKRDLDIKVTERIGLLVESGYEIKDIEKEKITLASMTDDAFNVLLDHIKNTSKKEKQTVETTKTEEKVDSQVVATQILNAVEQDKAAHLEQATEAAVDLNKLGAKTLVEEIFVKKQTKINKK